MGLLDLAPHLMLYPALLLLAALPPCLLNPT